jgi:hypothetical protein
MELSPPDKCHERWVGGATVAARHSHNSCTVHLRSAHRPGSDPAGSVDPNRSTSGSLDAIEHGVAMHDEFCCGGSISGDHASSRCGRKSRMVTSPVRPVRSAKPTSLLKLSRAAARPARSLGRSHANRKLGSSSSGSQSKSSAHSPAIWLPSVVASMPCERSRLANRMWWAVVAAARPAANGRRGPARSNRRYSARSFPNDREPMTIAFPPNRTDD